MMRWIVGSSLKFRFLVIALAVVMMYFGIAQLQRMPVDVFPEFAPTPRRDSDDLPRAQRG